MSWKIVSCSEQGPSHKEFKVSCQDYVNCYYEKNKDLVIGAVSDGSSSAKHSYFGAKLAVNLSIEYIKKNWNQSLNNEEKTKELFEKVFEVVLDFLNATAEKNSCSLKDFDCTLLVFIITSNSFAALQIGDGLIVIKTRTEDNQNNYQLLFMPHKGEFSNQTTFVTSTNAKNKMMVHFKSVLVDFICVGTDGIERLCLNQKPNQKWEAHKDFFYPLHQGLLNAKYQSLFEKEIVNLLNSEEAKQESRDDKTILLCVYEASPSSPEWSEKQLQLYPIPDQHKNKPQEITISNPTIGDYSEHLKQDEGLLSNNNQPKSYDSSKQKKSQYRAKLDKPIINLLVIFFCITIIILIIGNCFQFFKIRQQASLYEPLVPIYIDNKPRGFLFKKPTTSTFEAWVYVPLSYINETSITVPNNDGVFPRIHPQDFENDHPAQQPLIGYLYPGTYSYSEVKLSDTGDDQERRVKIEIRLDK